MARPEVLAPESLDALDLPGWQVYPTGLDRDFQAPTFLDAVELIRRVAIVMEQMEHHADVDLRWRQVHVHLFTHDPKGVSTLDVEQARAWDTIATELGCS